MLKTVAEGVETDRQSSILSEIGCSCLQGYLYARPMPAEDVLAAVSAIRTKGFKKKGVIILSGELRPAPAAA